MLKFNNKLTYARKLLVQKVIMLLSALDLSFEYSYSRQFSPFPYILAAMVAPKGEHIRQKPQQTINQQVTELNHFENIEKRPIL